MDTTNKSERRKPGPVKQENMVRTSLLINRDKLELAKKLPGGFADLVRDCVNARFPDSSPESEAA